MAKRNIFRAKAISQISAPEALNERIKLLPSKMWLAMLPVFLILTAAVIWGIFGRINIEVVGSGIITELCGTRNINTKSDGIIKHIAIEKNQKVTQGQLLAILDQHLTEIELKQLMDKLILLETQFSELAEGEKKEFSKIKTNFQSELISVKNHIHELSASYKYLREKQNENFYKTLKPFLNSEKNNTRYMLSNVNENLLFTDYKALWEKLQEIILTENELISKTHEYIDTAVLTSPVTGVVSEIFKKTGDQVMNGENILSVTPEKSGPAIITAFISANDSKNVKAGQTVHVAPVNVEPEKHGYMVGKIRYMANTPDTSETLSSEFNNRDIVEFLKNGEQLTFKVIVEIFADSGNPTGIMWTSRAPKNMKLSIGTPCRVSIISERNRPATYILPWLNRQQGKKQGE